MFSEIPRQSEHFNISQYLINTNKMPPPVQIFSKKMDDKQVFIIFILCGLISKKHVFTILELAI